MGGESTELAPPPVLSAPRLASVGPSVASAASQSSAVAAAGGAASTAASPSSTMTEGAERFRGLWEDEMFARQERSLVIKHCHQTRLDPCARFCDRPACALACARDIYCAANSRCRRANRRSLASAAQATSQVESSAPLGASLAQPLSCLLLYPHIAQRTELTADARACPCRSAATGGRAGLEGGGLEGGEGQIE